jgi:HEAT repeat protein
MTLAGRVVLIATCVAGTLCVGGGNAVAAQHDAPPRVLPGSRGAPTAAGSTRGAASPRRPRALEAAARRTQPAESERIARAKDLMSDEQWIAAIPVLRDAVDDPAESNKDEALFWLAHSQNQAGDLAESVESIRRLQAEYPSSRWSRPAFSLLIELAQKLGREDVLWRAAAPPPPPSPPAPAPPGVGGRRPAPPPPPPPPVSWLPETYRPDADLRIQALGRLIRTDAEKAIPVLRTIALDSENPAVVRRALFVLAQSRNPDAQTAVVDLAKLGSDVVRIAAVRELGRFGGPEVSQQLLQVYPLGNTRVKAQVVASLAEREDAAALVRIARSERDGQLRNTVIIALGRAGGREHLRALYAGSRPAARRAVIAGLFNARDDEGLIGIATRERDAELRAEAISRLRLMGTPKARAYVEQVK